MMSQPSRQATAASMALTQQLTVAQTGTDAVEVRYATRHPRTAFIETAHTGTAPLKKNWSYYKRTGSSWEDVDHIPPARLKLFVRPDLGLAAACAINKRYEQEQALADMHGWAQAMNRAKLRQVLAQRREVRERVEDYIGMRRPRTQQYARSGLQSPSTASSRYPPPAHTHTHTPPTHPTPAARMSGGCWTPGAQACVAPAIN
ncbi:hypothetical protein T492DRAFT_19455 [Pavlovales sp. CCMP2436]|nr:hypothetical protein T492DRAFT_19455 [Pavlovales sp. CCMP2436]